MMAEFLSMGGYGWYVWMSYGACALAVVLWRVQAIILEREKGSAWVGALPALKEVAA